MVVLFVMEKWGRVKTERPLAATYKLFVYQFIFG